MPSADLFIEGTEETGMGTEGIFIRSAEARSMYGMYAKVC